MRMRRYRCLIAAVLLALSIRAVLLLTASVPFNSDEAIVGLMARHILQGERPLFFYGQSYMGSLDAYLIAAAFRILGESVLAIRLVQMLLYTAYLWTAWRFARRVFIDPKAADWTVLILALPPVVVTTYTSATLGGYGESLLLGNLLLLLGYEVVFGERSEDGRAWFGLGLLGGLAFWTLGIAGVYLLPVAAAGLLRIRRKQVPGVLLAAAGFILGSLPWWVENFTHNWAALDVLLGRSELQLGPTSPWDRAVGFLLLGLSSLGGYRLPWESAYEAWWMVLPGVLLLLAAGMFVFEVRRRRWTVLAPGAELLLALFVGGFLAVFVGTHFGVDSTGRYLLPLHLPLGMALGALAVRLEQKAPRAGLALLAVILLFNLAGTWRAASRPDGLTTQFDPITRFNNDSDAELISFLDQHDLTRGYSNYWVSYRMAFLTGERLILSPRLPYKADLSYTPHDDRIRGYDERVDAAPRTVYITTLHPELDARMAAEWQDRGVAYQQIMIGPYHVFYNFSEKVLPEDLALQDAR